MHVELEQLPVALAPDEDARRAGKQLSRLEEAVTRSKTVCFPYPSGEGEPRERTLDPYSLFLIHGHWYVVGHDHLREDIRTFRLGRIKGTVTLCHREDPRFLVPPDYDPDAYRARPPWLYRPRQRDGHSSGSATTLPGGSIGCEPHVSRETDEEPRLRGALSSPFPTPRGRCFSHGWWDWEDAASCWNHPDCARQLGDLLQ